MTVAGDTYVGGAVTVAAGATLITVGDLSSVDITNNGTLQVSGNTLCGDITNSSNIQILHDLECSDLTSSAGNIQVGGTASMGDVGIVGNLQVTGNVFSTSFTLSANATFQSTGNCQIGGIFNASFDGVTITISGDCKIAGALTLGAGVSGTMHVMGSMQCPSAHGLAGSTLTIDGDATLVNNAPTVMAGPF
jgi:hypothetical protein